MPRPTPFRRTFQRFLPFVSAGLLLGTATAHAAEAVTLRSGFTVVCSSREAVAADRVRLHLQASPGNYMEVPLSSISAVESLPETAASDAKPALAQPQEKNRLTGILQSSGAAHNVNVALLASVIRAESGGNAHAVSRVGARGLMQLMPQTAAALGVHDSFAEAENVNGGSAYLDALLTRYHENVTLALAAYNAGPAAVDRYRGVPPYRETRLYVARVLTEFNRLVKQQSSAAIATALPQSAGR